MSRLKQTTALAKKRKLRSNEPILKREPVIEALRSLKLRILKREEVSRNEMQSALQSAAYILCSSKEDSLVIQYFVELPFIAFSQKSVRLGLSVWLGVIKENSRLEPRLFAEIIENWTLTIQKRLGFFSTNIQ